MSAEELEDFVNTLRGFTKAYPEDIFLPLTEEQIKEHSLVITRASAGMGRHLAKFFAQAAEHIEALERRIAELERRYQWAANELLACDYGDNPTKGEQVGWIVYGWRHKDLGSMSHADKPRIFGASIDKAIDAAIAAGKESE
jgi:hypothetical protein